MISISPYTSSPDRRVMSDSLNVATPTSVSPDNGKMEAPISTSHNGIATVSILARQLSDAATRAETPMGQKNAESLEPMTDDKYFANKAQHDGEIPTTDDPELLARAQQATGFLNGHDSNPFKGLARDQLNLIAHDSGGVFTVNERRAALEAMQSMESPEAFDPKPTPVNGREIMILRLFRGSEPPVALPPATSENGTQRSSEFLTLDDRALISDMYAYAQSEGADLRYVDRLVSALGTYRHYSDGRQLIGSNGYYVDEYWTTFDFKPEDAIIASNILTGSAFSSTRIDQGFLQHILSPGNGAFSHIGGIPFLEQMVKRFSSEAVGQPPLGSEFATFEYAKTADHIVSTTHKDIKLPPSKVVVEVVNGVWSVTEYGKAAGYTLDSATRRVYKPIEPPADQVQQRSPLNIPAGEAPNNTLLDALADTREQPTTRWIWPGHLFKLMKNFKP
ncbi:hypothetical protein [Pseudomonas trivialis]|uniref:hypothetical protein n=1 Tax=Pseudomonas trivialis TaxID=200450 RepID=UPI001187344A|nr:hypothetical protein [Pseudomonas trivialis]